MAFYDPADVMRRDAVAPMTTEVLVQIDAIKRLGQSLYDTLGHCPPSADMTLAKRKVEEAVMWAVKAITA